MTAGDVVAQKIIEERSTWDRERTTRFAIIGACLFGPCCTVWYRYLDKLVPRLKVPKPYHGLAKTTLDQGIFAPTICFAFFNVLGNLRGDPWSVVKHSLINDYPDVLVNNYKFWPGIQLLNFYLVPLQHRVLVVNVAALCWNTYLSWRTNVDKAEVKVQEMLPDVEIGYWAGSKHPRVGNHPLEYREK